MSADSSRIIVFDTTLRDGEQSPGVSLNIKEKVMIARTLAKLGVDVIEAGFPVSSPGDFEGVRAVADEVGVTVCGLARCVEGDITRAWEAVRRAEKPRIHVFLATSKIHRQFKLRKAEEEIIRLAVEGVKLARSLCKDIEFSPEDASRTEPKFLSEVVEAVIAAGASTVNIPDTVGYAMPAEFGSLIRHIVTHVPNINKAVISVHCHNDLGLATANSLAAVAAGARQVECTINGIGERAGNAALEEVVMALATRADFYGKVRTGINSRQIFQTSRLVSNLTGMPVQRNKSIVGDNAFAHSSGIHQDGVLKERSTYEIIAPEDVGVAESLLILDKHSGRHALKARIAKLGYELPAPELDALFVRFKELADKKREVYDADLEALLEDRVGAAPTVYQLDHLSVTAGTSVVPTATIRLRRGEEVLQDAATGDGPVDAVYKAIERLTGVSGKLLDYQLRSVSRGQEAMGEVMVAVQYGDVTINGRGLSTDIVEASGRAYLEAVNRAVSRGLAGAKASKGKAKGKSKPAPSVKL